MYRPKEFRSFPDFSSPIDRVKKWGAVGVLFPPQKVIPPVLFIFPQKRKKKTYISISLLPPVVMNDSLEPRQKSGGTAAGSGRSSSSSPAVLHNIYEEEEEEEKTRVIRSEGGQERERDILAVTTRRWAFSRDARRKLYNNPPVDPDHFSGWVTVKKRISGVWVQAQTPCNNFSFEREGRRRKDSPLRFVDELREKQEEGGGEFWGYMTATKAFALHPHWSCRVCVCAPSPSRSLGTAWRPPLHHLLWYAPARVDVGTRAWIYGWMPNKPRQPTDFPS